MRGVVTLSASYGAHGDTVGRALAGRLQFPFVDRVIPTAAAALQLGLPEDVAESLDEHITADRGQVRQLRDARRARSARGYTAHARAIPVRE